VAFGTTFVIDPLFSLLVIGSLTLSVLSRPAPTTDARIGLLALVGYLSFQMILQQQAKCLGEGLVQRQGLAHASVHALPQPPWPFNWLIIVSDGQHHHVALVNLAHGDLDPWLADKMGELGRLWRACQPPDGLVWETHSLYGDRAAERKLVEQTWQLDAFAEFRRFAKFPVLYRIDDLDQETCVWYTDLRYVLPGLIPPFRYGMCGKDATDSWLLYRLRRFTQNDRHCLGRGGIEPGSLSDQPISSNSGSCR
jgi:inner membrane protein